MASALINTSLKDDIFRITLDHYERRNALSLAMLEEIDNALDAARDNGARAIIIGATGNIFCPGHDLKEMTAARSNEDRGRAFFEKTMSLCSKVMQNIVNHPLPVIAEVNGVATAAGCQLVASCDLAVASDRSQFATPGVNIGLFCSTPMVALSRNVTNKQAMEMLLTGESISAQKASEIGLINYSVAETELQNTTRKLTDAITSKSAMTLKIGKQAYYKQSEMPLAQAYEYCAGVMVENMLKRDAEEGINAFIEKRTPEWHDE
ncbi:MAG: enoyl-CoA hydratase [Pseudomonadota bacterium]